MNSSNKENILQRILPPEKYKELQERTKELRTRSTLDSLVNIGYLTPDEAKSLQEPLKELPKSKKLLIACYLQYSKAIDYSKAINGDFLTSIRETIRKRDLSRYSEENKSIRDILGTEETNRLLNEWDDALISSAKEIVTTFVCEKRRRIRGELKKALLLRMANALSVEAFEDEETGELFDSIPYLREMAKANGYREDAQELNEADRTALSLCADHYLDLLELLYINGTGEERTKAYEALYDEEGYLKESFYYKDIKDEALMEFGDIYYLLSNVFYLALQDKLALKDTNIRLTTICREINAIHFEPDDLVVGRVLNTKFREYAINLYRDEQFNVKLSPDKLEKWEKFLNSLPEEALAPDGKKASARKNNNKRNKKK